MLVQPVESTSLCKVLVSDVNLQPYIEGFRLQGAAWNGKRLVDCAADAPPFASLPPCKIAWVTGSVQSPYATWMPAPLYLTTDRETCIAELHFPVGDGDEQSKWVLTGTACFLGA